MKKTIFFIAIALLFGAQTLQGQKLIQPSQDTAGKTPFFIFNPEFSVNPLYYSVHSKGQEIEYWAKGPGVRITFNFESPNWVFAYSDLLWEKYKVEDLTTNGPKNNVTTEEGPSYEFGFGVGKEFRPDWGRGFGIGGELTGGISPEGFKGTLGVGLSWEHSWGISAGLGNFIIFGQPGIVNPYIHIGYEF